MRPTLFYIPPELFGIPLFGFGLLFWIVFAVTLASMIWAWAVRKNREDFWSNLLLGAVAAVLVAWVAPAVGEGKGFPIRGYGVFLMLAILCAAGVVLVLGKKRRNLSPDVLLPLIIVQVVFGILGARLFYLAEYWGTIRAETFSQTFWNAVNLTRGGLVVFGSIIGGIIASIVYLRIKKLPVLATLDLTGPALMIGIALGRLGCFMNGCCFGAPCDCACGVVFPLESPAHFSQMENGEVPLGSFTLAEPTHTDADAGTFFHIKEKGPRLRGSAPEAVRIASVVPDSEAERAGLTPGMVVLRVGLIPESAEKPTEAEIERAATFPIRCNDDMFRFILYESGALRSDPTLIFDVEPLDVKEGETRFERLAFHSGPFSVKPVHPTQLYSAACALALFFILLLIFPHCRRDGTLFAWMLILYSTVRFFLEMVRTDEASFLGTGLSVSQCVSLGTATLAAAALIYLYTRKERLAEGDPKCRTQ